MKKIAVIFDMDGVLIDSQPQHYEIDMRVLKSYGYPAELSTVTPYTGVSTPKRWPKYKETLNLKPSVEELIQKCEETIVQVFSTFDFKPMPGLIQLLQNLKAQGVTTAVASSSSHFLINMVLNRIGILNYFDVIVSGEEVKNGKPHPDIYLKAAKDLGVSIENSFGIEDSPTGMLAVKNAKMTCIAYKNPNTFGQEFSNASYVIDHFNECLEIIKKACLCRED